MLLLGGAESTRKSKHMQGHVAIAAPKEGRRRPIIRSKRACSGSNRRTVSTSPLPCRPRRAAFPFWHEPVFHEIPRAAGPIQQTTKNDRLSHEFSCFFMNFRGPQALTNRRQKAIVCPTSAIAKNVETPGHRSG